MKMCIQNGIFEQWVWVVDESPKIKNDNMIIIIFHEDVLSAYQHLNRGKPNEPANQLDVLHPSTQQAVYNTAKSANEPSNHKN
jgi:hypothetical protein